MKILSKTFEQMKNLFESLCSICPENVEVSLQL